MSANISGLVDTIRDRIAEFTRDRTRFLPADEQTRLSWASVAKSRSEVPEIYHEFFDALPVEEKDPFPYTVISPTYKGFLQPENEKVICRADDSLCILEQKNGGLIARRYPRSEIFLLETGTILLNSWFTIRGTDSTGAISATTIKFNSVTEHLYAPFVEWFRLASKPAGEATVTAAGTSPFDALAEVNFKFMNYGRKTISPGEQVLQILLQPEIRETVFAFLRYALTRRVAPAHLAILTERDLILIRDDPSQRVKTKTPYGGIWNYIPLSKIESVLLIPGENNLLEISVHLPKNQHVNIPYEEAKRPEAEKLRKRILEKTANKQSLRSGF
jgi:hypothetical protein